MLTGETPSPLSLIGRKGEKEGYYYLQQLIGIWDNIFATKCIKKPFIIFIAEVMEVEII